MYYMSNHLGKNGFMMLNGKLNENSSAKIETIFKLSTLLLLYL